MEVTAHEILTLTNAAIMALEATGRTVPADLELLRNEAEYEARAGLPDPMQLRARLDLMDAHAEAI